jgi:hypothetical protein
MQRLSVSDEVVAKLRGLGQGSGLTQDELLRRLLGCPPDDDHPGGRDEGFIDATYGVLFAEGFEIFRTYKGRPYTARVTQGRWRLDGGNSNHLGYNSLNQLSQAVIDGNENAWMFWFFKAPDGAPKRIAQLRDPGMVQKRPRKRRRPPAGEKTAALKTVPIQAPALAAVQPSPLSTSGPLPEAPTPASSKAPGGKPWEPTG